MVLNSKNCQVIVIGRPFTVELSRSFTPLTAEDLKRARSYVNRDVKPQLDKRSLRTQCRMTGCDIH